MRDWMFPRQRWLMKNIPNYWVDKDEVLRIAIFNCLVNFVERETPETYTDWTSDDKHKEAWRVIQKCYHYIIKARPELIETIEKTAHDWSQLCFADSEMWITKTQTAESEVLFAKLHEQETLLDNLDEKTMIDIVKVRGFLWV